MMRNKEHSIGIPFNNCRVLFIHEITERRYNLAQLLEETNVYSIHRAVEIR